MFWCCIVQFGQPNLFQEVSIDQVCDAVIRLGHKPFVFRLNEVPMFLVLHVNHSTTCSAKILAVVQLMKEQFMESD